MRAWSPLAPSHGLYDPRLVQVEEPVAYWADEALDIGYVIGAKDWHPTFQPDYSPRQMALMGVFGDAYWGDALGQERAALLPASFTAPKEGKVYTNHRSAQAKRINYHGRPASFPRDWWLDKGLIFNYDPLGWYEWYCWYWLGRRVPHYDAHQIWRWRNFVTRTRAMYQTTGHAGSAQALLHWAAAPEERC